MHWGPMGPHESSTALGQWVHDSIPRDFWFKDDDVRPEHFTVGKVSTHIFREIEHKFRYQLLSIGELELMTLQARAIQSLVDRREVSPFSGAFVVYTDPPYVTAAVEKIHPDGTKSLPIRLMGEQVKRFIGCRVRP
jgi:hypothetical protein